MARSAERAPAEQRSDEIEERRGEERSGDTSCIKGELAARSAQCAARCVERAPPRSEATRQRSGAQRRDRGAERRCVKGERAARSASPPMSDNALASTPSVENQRAA